MSNTKEHSDNKTLIDTEIKTSKDNNIKKNILSEKHLDQNILNNSKDRINSKKIILNAPINITVELGRSKIKIKDFLSFSKGSMLILDKSIKDPLDIFINGYFIASGEIVVLEKNYGLRITSIKKSLKKISFLS